MYQVLKLIIEAGESNAALWQSSMASTKLTPENLQRTLTGSIIRSSTGIVKTIYYPQLSN